MLLQPNMDDCIFCKITKGEIPSYKVWEDGDSYAFLDIRPVNEGHTLVIPKKHSDYLFEIEPEEYQNLMGSVKKVAELLKGVFEPKTGKVGMIVYGLDVSHTHIHLSPLNERGGFSLANAKPASKEELQVVLDKIKSHQ